jgi:hypothetical protein
LKVTILKIAAEILNLREEDTLGLQLADIETILREFEVRDNSSQIWAEY